MVFRIKSGTHTHIATQLVFEIDRIVGNILITLAKFRFNCNTTREFSFVFPFLSSPLPLSSPYACLAVFLFHANVFSQFHIILIEQIFRLMQILHFAAKAVFIAISIVTGLITA